MGALPRAKRREKTIGRGTPCGRPWSAIWASELRCVCPAPPAQKTLTTPTKSSSIFPPLRTFVRADVKFPGHISATLSDASVGLKVATTCLEGSHRDKNYLQKRKTRWLPLQGKRPRAIRWLLHRPRPRRPNPQMARTRRQSLCLPRHRLQSRQTHPLTTARRHQCTNRGDDRSPRRDTFPRRL